MDRATIFIDVGYLMAEAGNLCCGTKSRGAIQCSAGTLTVALANYITGHCSLQILRTYWYDAAREGVPTPEHLAVADLPNVKLRLGRLSGGQQKGVDALIYRDLMTLARERAMASAYLLAGDEDLREGVAAAQDMGVRVVLLGIPAVAGNNQSRNLIREADDHLLLARDFWAGHFQLRAPTAVQPTAGATLASAPSPTPTTPSSITPPVTPPPEPEAEAASTAGRDFAQSWAAQVGAEEMGRLLTRKPRIPREADAQLMRAAEATLGSLRKRQDLRERVRHAFWDVIIAAAAPKTADDAAPGGVEPRSGSK